MKLVTDGFNTLEVEKVKFKPKGGLFLPYFANINAPTCFVRVLSEGPYKGMIGITHPGLVKHIEVPGLDTYLVYTKDFKAFVKEEDGEEFYRSEEIPVPKDPDSEWVNVL